MLCLESVSKVGENPVGKPGEIKDQTKHRETQTSQNFDFIGESPSETTGKQPVVENISQMKETMENMEGECG